VISALFGAGVSRRGGHRAGGRAIVDNGDVVDTQSWTRAV